MKRLPLKASRWIYFECEKPRNVSLLHLEVIDIIHVQYVTKEAYPFNKGQRWSTSGFITLN